MERRWGASELSGGKFCEIVYTILDGYSKGTYSNTPTKPTNFVSACRVLENNANAPRSFQILIPRLLPALYEIRNNRNVGHVGSDVNPDYMDSSVVLSIACWVMAELIRVFHGLTTDEAQKLVDNLAERRIPLVWKSDSIRRVLNPDIKLHDQVLLLISSVNGKVATDNIFQWTGAKNRVYFNKLLQKLHVRRLIEHNRETKTVEILPPGAEYVTKLLKKLTE